MKVKLCTILGIVGGIISSLLGGWDTGLKTLVLFMAIDYITGLMVAGVFHTSPKTENGSLESRAGWKGLCRKGVTLLVVLVAYRLDLMLNISYARDAAIIGFSANELISITENAGLMGIPLPAVITKAIEVLSKKSETLNNKSE
jgi:toxin secretion/phage lysis holin